MRRSKIQFQPLARAGATGAMPAEEPVAEVS